MKSVIVIGYNYTTVLGLVRCVGEAGYGVKLISLTPQGLAIILQSKYIEDWRLISSDYEQLHRAMEELRGGEESMLVLPAQDRTCELLDEHAEELSSHYILPNVNGTPGEVFHLMDKLTQKELARSCGLTVAEGQEYDVTEEGIQKAIHEVPFPCLVKPAESILGGKDMIKPCNTAVELENQLKYYLERGCGKVLIERFLHVEKELSAYGCVLDGKVVLPAYMTATSGGVGPHLGIAAEGQVLSAEKLGDLKNKLVRFVKSSGLNGLFCIDLLLSEGKIYFSEMNLRCGASEYAITAAGVNLPGMLLDAYQGKELNEDAGILREVHFINEKVVLDSWRGGHISTKECWHALADIDIGFVKNKLDPKPWKRFKYFVFRKVIGRVVKGPLD